MQYVVRVQLHRLSDNTVIEAWTFVIQKGSFSLPPGGERLVIQSGVMSGLGNLVSRRQTF